METICCLTEVTKNGLLLCRELKSLYFRFWQYFAVILLSKNCQKWQFLLTSKLHLVCVCVCVRERKDDLPGSSPARPLSLSSGDLAYHTNLVDLLTMCTEGKNVATEIKCTSLLPLDEIVRVVTDWDCIPEVHTCVCVCVCVCGYGYGCGCGGVLNLHDVAPFHWLVQILLTQQTQKSSNIARFFFFMVGGLGVRDVVWV